MAYCKKCYKLKKEKEKLVEIIQTIVADQVLWRCSKCGYFSPKGHVCWDCKYDPTV